MVIFQGLVGHELVDGAVVIVIEKVEFIILIDSKGDDALIGLGQLRVRYDFVTLKARAPDFARDPVAAYIVARQTGEFFTAVNVASRDGCGFGVRKGQIRRQNRGRSALAFGPYGLRSLHDGPAVVAAALDAIDHLPKFPADVADPQIAGRTVKTHAPGIAKAVSPYFGPCFGRINKGIIGGNRVRTVLVFMVHVDSQDGTQEIADVLTGIQPIRRVGAGGVSGGDIEIAVAAEMQIAAIMTAGQPGDQNLFAGRIAARRIGVRDAETTDATALGQRLAAFLGFENVTNVTVPVLGEPRVESQSIQRIKTLDRAFVPTCQVAANIEKKIGLGAIGVHWKRINLAGLLAHEKPVDGWCHGKQQRVFERELGKRTHRFVRVRRVGSPHDMRSCPGNAFRNVRAR